VNLDLNYYNVIIVNVMRSPW